MERKKIISQGSLREFQNDGDDFDRYYLPARGLILPGETHLLPENCLLKIYSQQLKIIKKDLLLPPNNVLEIPDTDYLLDLAIFQNLSLLKDCLDSSQKYVVYPYAVTEETLQWIKQLQKDGFQIEPAFPKKVYFEKLRHPAHRGGWGRWVNEPDVPSFPEKYGLPYPVSWIGRDLNEVIECYQRVCEQTNGASAYLKPIFSAGGFTLAEIRSEKELKKHYQKLMEQGALFFDANLSPVEIQQTIEPIEGFYSFQYGINGGILTPRSISQQIMKDNQWQGNSFNHFKRELTVLQPIIKNFLIGYKNINGENFGWGGVDLAQTDSGFVILEHNGLRITGAHPAISLAQMFDVIDQPFTTLKSPGQVNSDLNTVWELLKKYGYQFNPSIKTGIFPIVWFPGSGMLWATGEKPQAMLETAYHLLARENYIIM